MRTAPRNLMGGMEFSSIRIPQQSLERLDDLKGRILMTAVVWLVVAFAPLVAFDAGGGQSAIDVVRYVAFRGLDRDTWYATSALSMYAGALSGSVILVGLVLQSVGFVSRDRLLSMLGSGAILVGLCALVVATLPVASITVLGTLALPHVGWWLTLFHTGFTLWLETRRASSH